MPKPGCRLVSPHPLDNGVLSRIGHVEIWLSTAARRPPRAQLHDAIVLFAIFTFVMRFKRVSKWALRF